MKGGRIDLCFVGNAANRNVKNAVLCLGRRLTEMSAEDSKAVVQLIGDDLFKATSPSGSVINVDTDSTRHSAPSPMELLLLALGSCTGVDVVSN